MPYRLTGIVAIKLPLIVGYLPHSSSRLLFRQVEHSLLKTAFFQFLTCVFYLNPVYIYCKNYLFPNLNIYLKNPYICSNQQTAKPLI